MSVVKGGKERGGSKSSKAWLQLFFWLQFPSMTRFSLKMEKQTDYWNQEIFLLRFWEMLPSRTQTLSYSLTKKIFLKKKWSLEPSNNTSPSTLDRRMTLKKRYIISRMIFSRKLSILTLLGRYSTATWPQRPTPPMQTNCFHTFMTWSLTSWWMNFK